MAQSMINAITIEDFPETDTLSGNDKVILFNSNSDSSFSPFLSDISAFAEYICEVSALEEISLKLDDLESKLTSFEKTLSSTYPIFDSLSSLATVDYANSQLARFATEKELIDELNKKALDEYLTATLNRLKARVQDMKKFLGSRTFDDEHGETYWGYKLLATGGAHNGE